MADNVPPGRAGRLWLRGRVSSARRGMELLDRKGQLLRHQLAGLALHRDELRRAWVDAWAEAETWRRRAAVLGGDADLALAAAAVAGRASVEIRWRNTMGVLHPAETGCETPALAPAEAAAGNAALAPAALAYRHALEAAIAYSAADRAHRVLSAELRATERRRRAIERHRLPALEDALQRLELRLEELERQERVVGRWAKQHGATEEGTPPPLPAAAPWG